MKKFLQSLLVAFSIVLLATTFSNAQVLEWRLANPTFSSTDPDGAGPATGVATFTLQIHTLSGTINNITGMSTGWSWQLANAMLPTVPAPAPTCGTNSVAQPSNVTMSSTFAALGFSYNNVNQCSGSIDFTVGGRTFDRRAVGTVDGGTINLSTGWVDVFTVTLWSTTTNSNAGSVMINSGAGGDNSPFSTYSVSDAEANEYVVHSRTFGTPLLLVAGAPLPVLFTRFSALCSESGTSISWSTATEQNNSHFEVQKSTDGSTWSNIGRVAVSSLNSNSAKAYQFTDKLGGVAQYRIKQVDLGGQTSYTDVVRISCTDKAFFVNIYPVPAKDKLTLVVGSDKTTKMTLRVLDNSGRVLIN
ncbi:MAG: hypothetical protein EOP51_33410, partial [Sphingobacteriales bacterium]